MKTTGRAVRVVVMPIAVWTRQAASGRTSDDRVAVHHTNGGVVIVVADGAGGQAGGSLAADAVLASIADRLRSAPADKAGIDWVELLRATDDHLAVDPRAGESTCVVAHVDDDGSVRGAVAGDTEAILVSNDASVEDLTAEQADARKKRLGSGRARPTSFHRRVEERTLLLATDGLFGYVPLATIARIVHAHRLDLDGAASRLVDAARLPSGALHDDIALAIARTARPRME